MGKDDISAQEKNAYTKGKYSHIGGQPGAFPGESNSAAPPYGLSLSLPGGRCNCFFPLSSSEPNLSLI